MVDIHGETFSNEVEYADGQSIKYTFQDGKLNVSEANLKITNEVKIIAEHLNGFPDVKDPERAALEIVAKTMVVEDMEQSDLSKLVGYDKWVQNFSDEINTHGVVVRIDDEGIGFNLQEGFNKEQAIARMNEEINNNKFTNLAQANRRGKDY